MRSRWKILAVCAVSTYVLCIYYSLFVNAEVRFWTHALKKKNQWVQKMDAEPGEKVVFAGGSTTLFALQSGRLFEERGIQSANMGMTVGMGIPFLLSIALEATQPGDTLVLLLEPNLLCEGRLEPTSLSVQTALRTGNLGSAFGYPVWDLPKDWGLILGSMRPGAYHSVTALLKVVFSRPAYRYPVGNIDESGCLFMSGVDPETQIMGKMQEQVLSEKGRDLLQFLLARCKDKNVNLYYSLPWILCSTEALEHNRNVCKRLEEQVSSIIPVLKDDYSGCMDDRSLFYDQVHLSPKGAVYRTAVLVNALVSDQDKLEKY